MTIPYPRPTWLTFAAIALAMLLKPSWKTYALALFALWACQWCVWSWKRKSANPWKR